ncbi:DUF2845 domain-containing protein [Legionella oakridgensis]|uniref:DUF2845 domain-containing protein n=2 Tax=Legionella oakridgensis TaxID=29423 RepID=W0BCS4_9GAMM|nr:DUF2845 domain-containing protein [Legionella oakridgensis]AHE66422.1 hypothetical protein Loa_00854 [Legionella oakridgensis ATCC 33761 = DSM 21215]ETO93825.1 hypothetical protein LOR_82c23440 [Legionella oakridgensis RV-2-2007]KTD36861.1 hypothetical protein Loak_1997 [Legionella oakridgensis]STY19598.1 Protein of uncharacterised function (DUF2845) [Legionella longbeachae]
MKSTFLLLLGISFPLVSLADQSVYCPQNHGYINVGMTANQVIAACGQPLSKRTGGQSVTQRIPVKQLIYTNLNTGSVYPTLNPIFNQWSLPSGSTGISLEVDIVNQKVSSVRINGSSTNAMSLCGGTNIQIGDDENSVYSACGNPAMVNNTYINQPIPASANPEVWVYQVDQYQQPMSLTFVNGTLQSIQ